MKVLKGMLYFDGTTIFVPHYTGEYFLVDCDEYRLESELNEVGLSVEEIHPSKRIEHKGITYYYIGYYPNDPKEIGNAI